MKKVLFVIAAVLCMLLTAACLAEDEVQVDVSFEGYSEVGGMLNVTWTDESDEIGGLGLIGTPGQTIGEMLSDCDIISIDPVLEGDEFEGWMEVAQTITIDEFGFEETEYSLIADQCYTTEELMALAVPEHNVMYIAKWASIPAEEYFAPYEEETIVLPSVTLFSGDGIMLIDSEEEQYEATCWVSMIEPGQPFGEVLELDNIAAMNAEGRIFVGWTVYEYDVETMEISEVPIEEENVLCFELFEDYYMVLREYTACAELLTTGELAEYVCEGSDHVVTAIWMTAEEYLEFVNTQSEAIKASLENDPLTQSEMNQKSQELQEIWDAALNYMIDEVKKTLPEAEAEALMDEQTAWLASRDDAAEAAGSEFEGGSMYALIVNSEAAALTEARVYELYELLK